MAALPNDAAAGVMAMEPHRKGRSSEPGRERPLCGGEGKLRRRSEASLSRALTAWTNPVPRLSTRGVPLPVGAADSWEYPLTKEEKKHRVMCIMEAELVEADGHALRERYRADDRVAASAAAVSIDAEAELRDDEDRAFVASCSSVDVPSDLVGRTSLKCLQDVANIAQNVAPLVGQIASWSFPAADFAVRMHIRFVMLALLLTFGMVVTFSREVRSPMTSDNGSKGTIVAGIDMLSASSDRGRTDSLDVDGSFPLVVAARHGDLALAPKVASSRSQPNRSDQRNRAASDILQAGITQGGLLQNVFVDTRRVWENGLDLLPSLQPSACVAAEISLSHASRILDETLAEYSTKLVRQEEYMLLVAARAEILADHGLAWVCSGRFEEGVRALTLYLNNVASASPPRHILNTIGYALFQLGDYHQAATMFRLGVDMYSTHVILWSNLAAAEMAKGDLGAADHAIFQAAEAAEALEARDDMEHIVRNLEHLSALSRGDTTPTLHVKLFYRRNWRWGD